MTLKKKIEESYFENKKGQKIALPLYLRFAKKSELSVNELNAYGTFTIVPSLKRQTLEHVVFSPSKPIF